MTSTLQQEGGRRLRLSSSQVMRIAQGLYERASSVRTDNVIFDDALSETRSIIGATYGDAFLSEQPRRHTSKSKNASARGD